MRHRGRWLLTAAAAALAVLATALAAASQAPASHAPAITGSRPGPAAPAARTAAPEPAAPAGGHQGGQAGLAGLRWTGYHGVELPSSPLAGPRDTAGGLASGFADTPLGALLAAVNIAVRANPQWGPRVFGPTIGGQVTGPDAAALLASCQAGYGQSAQAAGITGGQPLGDAHVAEQAFRWVAWSPSGATVDLVTAAAGSSGTTIRAVTRVQVTWDGGDWKVIAPLGGDWATAATVLESLAGYTVFPGQG
jgi:hypothetical protein